MKHKLLNFSKNLIISIGLVVMVMILFFTTSSYAASGDTLGKLMRATVSDWYRFILRVCLTVYSIAYLVILIKLLADRTPERIKIIKESIGRFFIMLAVIYFLHYIMIIILSLNSRGIDLAQKVGTMFSGIDMKTDEHDLYETALSKAYEFAVVPGFIGLIMYILLVYYTYKFVFVYAKRYINVIILILLAPIIFVMSTIKRILFGSGDGKIGTWFKEFIFNIVIQTLHAIFYAILIGLTLKLSDNDENLIGALLTLILFGFIFKIDAIIRKIFNFVGGSTNISSSKIAGEAIDKVGGAVNAGLDVASAGIDAASSKAASGIGKFGEDLNKNGGLGKGGFKNTMKEYGGNAKIKFKDTANSMYDAVKDKDSRRATAQKIGNAALDKTKQGGRYLLDKTKEGGNYLKDKALDGVHATADAAASAWATVKHEYNDAGNILNGERVKANLTADEIVEQQHIIDEAKGLEGIRQGIQHAGLAIVAGKDKLVGLGKYTGAQIKRATLFAGNRVKKGVVAAVDEFNHDVENLNTTIETVKRIPKIVRSLKKKQKYIKTANGLNADVSNTMMLVVDTDLSPEELLKELKEQYGDGIDVSAYVFERVGAQAFLSPAVGSPVLGMSVLAEANYEEKAEHAIDEVITGEKRQKRKVKRASRRQSRKAVKQVGKSAKKSELTNKVYKFSRFTPRTANKITKRMLKKSRQENRYLFVINKTYENIEVTRPRGVIKKKTSEVSRKMRITRKNVIKSVRQIKLSQIAALSNYRALADRTRKIEVANNVGGAVMTAKNTIRLGFKQIENMTPGQIGLRSMIQEGTAKEITGGLIAIKQTATVEDKVKATGLVTAKNEIVQFVVTQTGAIERQVVTAEGKIVEPAPELQALTSVVEQIVDNTEKRRTRRSATQEILDTIVQPSTQQNEQQSTTKQENMVKQETVVKQEVEQTTPIVNKAPSVESVVQDNITHSVSETVEQPVETRATGSEEKVVQHIITLEGKIVEQVVNKDNTIETSSYQVVDNGGDLLVQQLQVAMTNEDLGLQEEATAEEKLNKFEDLLQDLNSQPLLDQVLAESNETEDAMDEAILVGMKEAGINSMQELKQLTFDVTFDDELEKKKKDFDRAITDHMVSSGIMTYEEAEDDDLVGNALDVLNARVQEVTSTESDVLIDKAASMERVRVAEELLKMGEFTPTQPPTDADIDNAIEQKVVTLSELLVNLTTEKVADKVVDIVTESTEFPRQILAETVDAAMEVLDNAAKGTLTNEEAEAEKEFRKELEKAEKKWAKNHDKEASQSVVDRIQSQEKGEESDDVTVKITLKFFGGVEKQGQSVTLNNRYSLKDFYDKANKLESANFEKTQERFMQVYGDKLAQMQLAGFSFAKNPVADMDGWSIYIVTNDEDTDDKNDKEVRRKPVEDPAVQEAYNKLMEEYYSDIAELFEKFAESEEISSLDDIYKDSDIEIELVRKLRIFFFRHGEGHAEEKAREVVSNMDDDRRFTEILNRVVAKRLAAQKTKDSKSKVKITTKEEAEEEAAKNVTSEEVKQAKEKEKADLMSQVLEDTIAEQEEVAEAAATKEISDLLNQIKGDFVEIKQGSTTRQNNRTFRMDDVQ